MAGTVERRLRGAGVVLSTYAADAGVEAIELADHSLFLATAFQAQVGSSEAGMLHPLIAAFRDAARTVETVGRPGDEGSGI